MSKEFKGSETPDGSQTRSSSLASTSDAASALRTGGQLLADALATQGVDTIFGVPGESYLAALDGMYAHREMIRFVSCRQEGGASFMADAYAKLTGKTGVVMVTRGPGATNGSIGVHAAFQDSVPMVMFIGQVGSDFSDREAFQEIDYRRMFGQMAKWVAQIDRADRIPEYVAHAFQIAMSGRKGPVVLALPEDMLLRKAAVPDALHYQPVQASPSAEQIERLKNLLANAMRPLVILGGTGWTQQACADMRQFIEANNLPVTCAFRFQDVYDNRLPNYVGDIGIGINPKLADRVRNADVLLVIGPRLGEMTTSGYSLLQVPKPANKLIHVHAGTDELGTVYQGELMIAAGMPVASVMDLNPARVSVGVPEAEVGRVKQGATARIRIPSMGDRRFEGKVELVGYAAEPTSRTFTVRILVPNPDLTLRAGMVAEAEIDSVEQIQSLTLPGDAIVRDPQGATLVYGYFPDGSRVYARGVSVGGPLGREFEIVSGLTGDEQIVVAGQQKLKEGALVTVAGGAR